MLDPRNYYTLAMRSETNASPPPPICVHTPTQTPPPLVFIHTQLSVTACQNVISYVE